MPEKQKYVPPVCCLTCGVEIEPFDEPCNGDPYEMVKGSVVGMMYAPFGSENDGYIFQIGLCDKCIEGHLKTGKM